MLSPPVEGLTSGEAFAALRKLRREARDSTDSPTPAQAVPVLDRAQHLREQVRATEPKHRGGLDSLFSASIVEDLWRWIRGEPWVPSPQKACRASGGDP